jgi:hypothetical protein
MAEEYCKAIFLPLMVSLGDRNEPFLKNTCQRHKAQYVLAAAGEAYGTAIFNVHTNQLDCSSLLKEAEGASADGSPGKFR